MTGDDADGSRVTTWLSKNDSVVVFVLSVLLAIGAIVISKGDKWWHYPEVFLFGLTFIYLIIVIFKHFRILNDTISKEQNRDFVLGLGATFLFFLWLTVWIALGLKLDDLDTPPILAHIGLALASVCCNWWAVSRLVEKGLDPQKEASLNASSEGQARVKMAEEYIKELKRGIEYSDVPTLWSLVLLFMVVFAVWITHNATAELEAFAVGALTFQVSLSNFVYAKTTGVSP